MTAPRPKGTKRQDWHAMLAASREFHAARLAFLYEHYPESEHETRHVRFLTAQRVYRHACDEYTLGHRKASVAYGHRWAAKSKKEAK